MNDFLDQIEGQFKRNSMTDSDDLLELQTWRFVQDEEKLFDSNETFVTCNTHLSNIPTCDYCSSSREIEGKMYK